VDEEDVAMVHPGQPVLIRADAFPGQIFHAQVTEVTPKGDPIGRSYRVRILLPQDTPLRIGMTTESNIVIRRDDHALLLPVRAVANQEIWKIESGKAVRVRVTTGAKTNDWVEIRSGLSADDLVLRDGNARPGNAPRLRVVPP
jgi:multidrug efflux pump subunit AcrA (membrane-fusion protein)